MKQNNSNLLQHYFFVRCFALCVSLLFFVNISNAQKIKLYYDLKKDRVWVERQKAIVEKGFELHPYKKDNYLKQLKYVNSCVNLGRYFETMFDMRRISTMKKSVYFYEKVADFGRFPDDEKYFKALAIRNSVLRKLADIYFVGKGIKKDKKLSLELALAGSSGYDGFFTYYSKRYFNCNCIILKKKVVDDGYFYIIGNPFAMQANLLNVKTIDKFLIEIGNKFMAKKKLDSSLVLNIIAYPEMSFRSQSRADFLLENIKNFYLERMNFSIENIYVETRIDGGDPKSIDWFISKPELK